MGGREKEIEDPASNGRERTTQGQIKRKKPKRIDRIPRYRNPRREWFGVLKKREGGNEPR